MLSEGIQSDRVFVTGNTVIDALKRVVQKIENDDQLAAELERGFSFLSDSRRIVLITGHRRENFGKGFDAICTAIDILADRNPEIDFVYPVHLNPNVREPVNRLLANRENIHLIDPQTYIPFVYLMSRSYLILTDSGGVQEEAPSLGKPVLLMRDTTERPEAVKAGTVMLVGTNAQLIVERAESLIRDSQMYRKMSYAHNPYGDGNAAARVVAAIEEWDVHRSCCPQGSVLL